MRGAINSCARNHDSADYKTYFMESCFGEFLNRTSLAQFEIGTQFKYGAALPAQEEPASKKSIYDGLE